MSESEGAVRGQVRWPLALIAIMLSALAGVVVATATPIAARAGALGGPAGPERSAGGAPAPMAQQGYIGESRCVICHAEQAESFHATAHARAWDPRAPAAQQSCESCHGPGREHFLDPEAPGLIRSFAALSASDVNETCTTCHNRQEHAWWEGSAHDARNMSCLSCHSMHDAQSTPLLTLASETQTCAQCHQEKVARTMRSSHMPLREGSMTCSSCHNPHGASNVRLLRAGNSVNEACLSCHTEKRGPFLWEHPSVRESCLTCHDPHGSSVQSLLVARPPMLCQQCHTAAGHPSTIYEGAAVDARSNRIIARGCVNCHSNIHGSNHPAGARFQR